MDVVRIPGVDPDLQTVAFVELRLAAPGLPVFGVDANGEDQSGEAPCRTDVGKFSFLVEFTQAEQPVFLTEGATGIGPFCFTSQNRCDKAEQESRRDE